MMKGDVLAQPTDDDLLARELRRHLEAPAPREMVASRLTVRVSSTASAVRRSGGAARRETAEADTVSHGRSRNTRVPYVTCPFCPETRLAPGCSYGVSLGILSPRAYPCSGRR